MSPIEGTLHVRHEILNLEMGHGTESIPLNFVVLGFTLETIRSDVVGGKQGGERKIGGIPREGHGRREGSRRDVSSIGAFGAPTLFQKKSSQVQVKCTHVMRDASVPYR